MNEDKNKREAKSKQEIKKQKIYPPRQPWQKGGVYFHAAAIIDRKNVFVADEYIDLLVNAFKMAEVRNDVKNLAYVIMPNFFYWMFKLSDNKDNPAEIYGEAKKNVAFALLNNLRDEAKGPKCELAELFKNNERVRRSPPEKILWLFEDRAKKFKNNKKYRVWAPNTEIRMIENDEMFKQKLAVIKNAPLAERWQLVKEGAQYPYMYLAEELLENDDLPLSTFSPVVEKIAMKEAINA